MTAADSAAALPAYGDAELHHRLLNCGALVRRRGVHPRLRAHLERFIPELEDEADKRGLVVRGWRAYPTNLRFGAKLDVETGEVEFRSPPEAKRNRTRKPRSAPQAVTDAGAMLDAVMSCIFAQLNTAE